MEQTSPIYLSKEEFLSVQKRKIGYGKDGVTFRYNRQEIIKILSSKFRKYNAQFNCY